MINAYLIFCSCIYHFYIRRKEEDIPVFYTFCVSTVVFSLNAYCIYDIYMFLIVKQILPFTNFITYGFLAGVALINAAIIYSNPSAFKDIIPTRKQNYYSILYIIISFILIACTSTIYRNSN